MPEIAIYLLKANVSLVLFYLGYRLLLRRLTFYRLNRYYLLFGLLFSAIYPLVDISGWLAARQAATPEVIYLLPNWQQVPVSTFNWWPLITGFFWLGVIYFGWQLLIRLISLRQLHAASQPATWRLFRYRQVFDQVSPFTFWRNIYLNIHQHETRELAEIFSHEQVHANELHTVDVLLAELCRVCCWFNPGAWLIRRAIHENLEYITDRNVLRQGVDKKTYQYHLLKVSQYAGTHPEIASHFNFKSLKRRIAMMNRKRSSVLQLGNYVFAIPVIAVLVLVFSVSRAYQQDGAGIKSGLALDLVQPATGQHSVSVDTIIRDEAERKAIPETKTATEVPQPVPEPNSSGTITTEERGMRMQAVSGITIIRSDSSDKPLYVVDGFPMEGDGFLTEIKPEDIASISVWKDERLATSLYGEVAKNGLIVIKTKPDTSAMGVTIRGSRLDTAVNAAKDTLSVTLRNSQPFSAEKFAGVSGIQPDFNGALVIIDGKESTAAAARSLSKDKIKSIRVLKGDTATAAYGKKGENGVIEVAVQ